MTKKTQLEPWEVSLIKAMLKYKKFKKQEIVAFFSRPDRSINQARISEIQDGHDRYKSMPMASKADLDKFLSDWSKIRFPGGAASDQSPTHPDVLSKKFQRRANLPLRLNVSETSEVEAKSKFDWGSRHKYCRTLAGMANNKGGYILFGVEDGSFEVTGLKEDRMEKFDLAKANQYISRTFDQSLRVEKGQFQLGGKTIGVLYVHESDRKPVICKLSTKEFESGDVYFRYPGETRRIQEPELKKILQETERSIEKRFLGMMVKIGESGAKNSAVMDLMSGEVSGQPGTFLIDETLLDKIKFVSSGQFKEEDGEPALRLVGDVQPIGSKKGKLRQKVIASVTEKDIQKAFLEQECEYEPKTYISAQPSLQPKWFPVFYFARQAKMDGKQLLETLTQASTDYPARTGIQVDRVRSKALPAGPPNPKSVRVQLELLHSDDILVIEDIEGARMYLKALRIVDPKKIEFQRALGILRDIWMRFGDVAELRTYFRAAITSIDTIYFGDHFKF